MKKKQLLLNISANFLSVLVSLLISFFLTPYIVEKIGKEAYSFVPISNNFTNYLWLLSTAFTSTTARFVTLRTHQGDIQSAREYYSTSFLINLGIVIISSIMCFIIINFLDLIVNIPPSIYVDVKMLFILIFIAFIINVLTNLFTTPIFCMNRLDISSIISILALVFRITAIFILFYFFDPKVYFIGISILIVILVQGFLSFVYARKLMPQLKISIKYFKLKLIRELFSSGIWNSFSQLSSILLTGLDLLIANMMLGASASGILAVAKTAPMALQTLINVVPTTFSPHLTILYAKQDKTQFNQELKNILKYTSILTGIPIAAFIVLSPTFLHLWVPSVADETLFILSILTMISMLSSFSILPLLYVFTITNKLKLPSLSVFVSGALSTIIVIIVVKTSNFGLYAIAGVSSVFELIRYLFFIPMYAAYCLNERINYFYRTIFICLRFMLSIIIVFYSLNYMMNPNSWSQLFSIGLIMTFTGVIAGYYIVLNHSEKREVIAILKKMMSKTGLKLK